MTTRRDFISAGVKLTAAAGLAPLLPIFGASAAQFAENKSPFANRKLDFRNVKLPANHGLGGVAIGNAFRPTSDEQAREAMEAAWEAGVRFFDTSP